MEKERPVVLYVIDTLTTGGAEKSLLEISLRLKNFKPVVCVVFAKNDDLRKEFIQCNISVVDLNVTSKLWWLEGTKKLKKIIHQIKPDVIHATLFKSEIITRLATPRSIPQIGSFVNDSYGKERYHSLSMVPFCKLKIIQMIDAITARRTDHFLSITKAIVLTNRKALGIAEEKITVIYRGRDFNKLKNIDANAVALLKKQYGPGPIFLTVARLLKRKGYVEAIQAIAKIIEKTPTVRYLIAGEGHDRVFIETLIRQLNVDKNVVLLGNRKDVPELLSASDFFVFPSHYEGQGGALIESMLFSKPIIASRIPVIEEQVEHSKSARLFQLKNVEALYEQMMWMINNPTEASKLGECSKKIALSKFSIESVAEKHDQMYLKVVALKNKQNH